nr:CoA transferase [Amycolatopsis pithecellobii]
MRLGRTEQECVALDLSKPEGQEILRELVGNADVLIENFRPGTLERWGLGPDELHTINSRLVIVRTTAFGQDGPMPSVPGSERWPNRCPVSRPSMGGRTSRRCCPLRPR